MLTSLVAEYATAEYPAGEYEYDQASEGAITPRATGKFDISGNEGDYEALDPRYRVEPSHKFQPGEVWNFPHLCTLVYPLIFLTILG